jgi:hypothetical protein
MNTTNTLQSGDQSKLVDSNGKVGGTDMTLEEWLEFIDEGYSESLIQPPIRERPLQTHSVDTGIISAATSTQETLVDTHGSINKQRLLQILQDSDVNLPEEVCQKLGLDLPQDEVTLVDRAMNAKHADRPSLTPRLRKTASTIVAIGAAALVAVTSLFSGGEKGGSPEAHSKDHAMLTVAARLLGAHPDDKESWKAVIQRRWDRLRAGENEDPSIELVDLMRIFENKHDDLKVIIPDSEELQELAEGAVNSDIMRIDKIIDGVLERGSQGDVEHAGRIFVAITSLVDRFGIMVPDLEERDSQLRKACMKQAQLSLEKNDPKTATILLNLYNSLVFAKQQQGLKKAVASVAPSDSLPQ